MNGWLGAGVSLLVGAALVGCSHPADGKDPRSATPTKPAVADSFRSARTYQAIAVPVRLRIPAARVDAAVQKLGRAPDGTIAVPKHAGDVGWYAEGPRPGQAGPAVLLGHVDWESGPAVFFHLHGLRPGAAVLVDRADGSTARFRVTGLARVPKSRFPTDLVYSPSLEPSLRLVTCGGSFDHSRRSYRDNVIVFAAPF
jgi:sortase (surface protein transpeptidase)